MKFEFPDTGEGVTEGKFLEWKIEEGDEVEEDQVVGEAETDKAVVEIPAPADGTAEKLLVEPGDQVEVGEVIMEIDAGEQNEETEDDEPVEQEEERESSDVEEDVDYDSADVLALPKVRKKAEEKGINLEDLDVDGRIRMEDLEGVTGMTKPTTEIEKEEETKEKDQELVSTPEDVNATPSVRKLAREKEIDISKVEGSGKGGKITRDDVLSYPEKVEVQEVDETPETKETGESTNVGGEKLSGLEQNVAQKMEDSKFSAPHVTHVEKVDVTELVELREEANERVDPHLTYMPFIMKASILAMQDYPRMNAHFDGESMEIDTKEDYNFNIAVDTDRGLLVPRLDSVGERNLLEIAMELSSIVEKAQNGEIGREDMQPGGFSITNIGVIGGEEFTPIINPPQTCILGVGKIAETAEVVDGEIVPRMTMKLSFSYDHRVIDGATAAKFVNKIKENLENPEEMMVCL